MQIVLSSGHGKHIRGAAGPEPWGVDEVDEARRVVDYIAKHFKGGISVFHDDLSSDQSTNLDRIVDYHNSCEREIDISIHFNAYTVTETQGMGCEVLFLSQSELAKKLVDRIAHVSGLINRGPKKREDLYFLNKTSAPAVLIEVAFCDSKIDCDIYRDKFHAICAAISEVVSGVEPNQIPTGLSELLTIDGVKILQKDEGQYVKFISDLDICNDGTGPSHGDPYYQDQTAYYNDGKYLNADKDKYIVIPPQIRSMVPPVVMGCQARLTNLKTDIWQDAVTGEIGPSDKTGEAAYCLGKIVNPAITHNAGDQNQIYLYELWPGEPAEVDGVSYKLEPS